MLSKSDHILTGNVQLAFRTLVHWDIDSMSNDFVEWMTNDQLPPASTSRVGILTSFKFQRMVSGLLDETLSKNFRLLLETSSILYSHGTQVSNSGHSAINFCSSRSMAGREVLQTLESALSKSFLAQCSRKSLQALFLVLLGTIIAVGYSNRESQPANVSAITSDRCNRVFTVA